MAVGADQLAFRDLIEDCLAPESSTHEIAELSMLSASRKVIPLHGRVMERTSAIGARPGLQLPVPLHEVSAPPFPHLNPFIPGAPPVLSVVFPTTTPTPRLRALAATVERIEGLPLLAPPAVPHVARIEISPDNGGESL